MDKLIFKKLHDGAILPTRSNPTDAGLDLYAAEEGTLSAGQYAVGTGIAVAIPEGYYGRIAPRSGLALVNGINVLGGVVDSSYRGEILVILLTPETFRVQVGDRIAQLIIEKIETPIAVWGDLDETDRGADGFGSTG